MRAILILISVTLFVSCTGKKNIVISELDLESDRFYNCNAYESFNGTCKVIYEKSETTKLESSYTDGILNGETTLYREDGSPYRKGHYAFGENEGLWEGWFKNGKKEFEINYKNGKLNGEYIAYYQNGAIKERGEYRNDTRINEWIIYDTKGSEISRKIY